MLKKRSSGGAQTLLKCEECRREVKVLYDSFGKKVCKKCFKLGEKIGKKG